MPENKKFQRHIGDGLYMNFNGWSIEIAVNHHENTVAWLDINDFDTAIAFINECKKLINKKE